MVQVTNRVRGASKLLYLLFVATVKSMNSMEKLGKCAT
jgi:hypothetical protein